MSNVLGLSLLISVVVGISAPLYAQTANDSTAAPPSTTYEFEFGFDLGIGTSRIENTDGKDLRYQLFALMPEFSYGPWTGGLQVNFRTRKRSLRDEDFDDAGDYLAWLRFLQYGEKDEGETYARIGALDAARFGYGQHINSFTNTVSLDEPQTGIVFDHRVGPYQIETMFANIVDPGVMGARAAYQPFDEALVTPQLNFNDLTIGVSLSGDVNEDGASINEANPGEPFFLGTAVPDSVGILDPQPGTDDGSIWILGVDAGLPFKLADQTTGIAFVEASHILRYGLGGSFGVRGITRLPNRSRLNTQVEILLLGKEYLPNYFNGLYVADRIRTLSINAGDETVEAVNTKRNRLAGEHDFRLGSRASLRYRYQRKVRVNTSYEQIWTRKNSGWFHLDLRFQAPEWPYHVRVSYDRVNVGSVSDLFKLSRANALGRLEVAYRVLDFLRLGFGVKQSFEAQVQDGLVVGQTKKTRIEPQFIFSLPV